MGAGAATEKGTVAVLVPPGLVTVTLPAVAPGGTTAVRDKSDTTVKDVATVPLKLTAVAPVKPLPVRVTVAPAKAGDGEIRLIAGRLEPAMPRTTLSSPVVSAPLVYSPRR